MNLPVSETIDYPSSEFQQAIAVVEALPIDEQEVLVRLLQSRLRDQRRQVLVETVKAAEADYAAGNVKRGSIADLMAELDD
jgi:hypothetical protein